MRKTTEKAAEATDFLLAGDNILLEIKEKWDAGFSCKVVGFPGMGMTSTLQKLHARCSREGTWAQKYLSVCVGGSYRPEAFSSQLARRVAEVLGRSEVVLKSKTLRDHCAEVSELLAKTDKIVVFLLDDFAKSFPAKRSTSKARNGEETILTEPEVTKLGVWEETMRPVHDWKTRFAVAYHRPVGRIVDSGWYLKFHSVYLDLLSAERIELLLKSLRSQGLKFDERKAVFYGGRHPVHLEHVARALGHGHSEESIGEWLCHRYVEMRSHLEAAGGQWDRVVAAAREPSAEASMGEGAKCLFYADAARRKFAPFSAHFGKYLTEVRARAVKFFVSYSRKDVRWVDPKGDCNLIPWLERALRGEGAQMWYDHALEDLPGEPFRPKIEREIGRADFAILLLSQDFAISDFIRDVELPLIRERVERRELTLLPIVVGPIDWENETHLHWIKTRQMLTGVDDPIAAHTKDRADFDALRVRILHSIRGRMEAGPPAQGQVRTAQ